MTNTQWETLSVQAIAVVAVVYFLAFLAHLVEWSALRSPARELVAAGSTEPEPDSSGDAAPVVRTERAAISGRFALLLTLLGAVVHLVGLVGRGMAADPNRVPWGNMYEFVLTGTFVVVAIYLLLLRKYSLAWLGPVVTGFAISILMLAQLSLYEQVAPLTEALSSPWLVIHVVAAIIATGAFTLGGMASVLFLVKERWGDGARPNGFIARMPTTQVLDRLSYRLHAFGFPVWTFAVLIAGPIWAHYAWSRYWGWDAKEVWAFITWVVYAAYLHARATAGWKGRNAAIIALVGLATLWFNFIGINFFFGGSSQHSYAAPATQVVVGPVSPGQSP